MKINKEKWRIFLNTKKPHRIELLLVILAGVLLNLCYLYTDIADATAFGVRFWTSLFGGKFPMLYWDGYYGAKGSVLELSMGGSYDFAFYLIFAIYDFPLWVWEKLSGFSFTQFIITREYIKGIVWIFSSISAYLLYKVARECDVDEEIARWCPLLFFSSSIFFYTEVVIGGMDVLSVTFTLLGLYFYLKGNNKGFVAFFAVAAAMKMFALWIFIPLVLLKEKRIWRILVYGIESISVIAIPKIYFAVASHRFMGREAVERALQAGETIENAEMLADNAGYATNEIIASASGILNDALFPKDRFLEYTFISMDALPLVFVGMFMIWLFCYIYKGEATKRQIIYLCTLTMSVFILTVKIHPYWGIILVPYLILTLVLHPQRLKENLILEGVLSIGYILNKAVTYPWTCNLNIIENMTMPQHTFSYGDDGLLGGNCGFSYYITRLSEKISINATNIGYIFKAASVAGLIMFLIWNYSGRRESTIFVGEKINYMEWRKWLFVRFVGSCFVGMMPMLGIIVHLTH